MLHKSFDILDAKADSEAGTFEATVAVFGNVDKIGDRIVPGAFKDTLAKWAESGDPIPVILSHQWDNPMAHIGVVDQAMETDKGLWVKGTLDVKDNDVARQVHKLMKRRSLKEFSFGYSIPKGGERRAKDGANDLLRVDLAEVGPTLKGMNPATELHAVKSALDTADKVLIAEDELEGAKANILKAVWTVAFINDLPDSSFLYIEPGGDKDADGKTTPRSLRHFPYKDSSGAVDMPHLRNALSRIPQSSLPQDVKDRLTAKAQRILDSNKSEPEPGRRTHSDSLSKQARSLAQEILKGDADLNQAPAPSTEPKPSPTMDEAELRKYSRGLMVQILSGIEER